MSLLDRLHGGLVHERRVRVLAERIAVALPKDAEVLDVGCGDGLLSAAIAGLRPDLEIRGIDSFVRPDTAIPVEHFDGSRIALGDDGVEAVLLIDVIHHAEDPMALLTEAARVARKCVVIKDHLMAGSLDAVTLRFMDWIGNARHGVALPFNYRSESWWREAFARLDLDLRSWETKLGLYPWPADRVFGRGLHFLAALEPHGGPGE